MFRNLVMFIHRRLVSAFWYSLAGFGAAWKSEEAIKVEVALFPGLVMAALWLGETGLERALLVTCLILVIVVELLNTAIEKTIDRISFERNDLSKTVKDMGSAAVLGAILNVAIVWGLILGGH